MADPVHLIYDHGEWSGTMRNPDSSASPCSSGSAVSVVNVPDEGEIEDAEVQGKKLCRHGFMALYGLKKHHLDAARKTVDSGHGSLVVHGNQVSSVQAARGAMKTAIQNSLGFGLR